VDPFLELIVLLFPRISTRVNKVLVNIMNAMKLANKELNLDGRTL
jgi:hypothetical protein